MRVVIEHITHPDASLRWLDLQLDAFGTGPHRHPHLELTWILAGTGLRFCGDSVEPFEAGDLVLVGPELSHAWLGSPPPGAAPGSFRARVLQFPPGLLAPWPEAQSLRALAERARQGLAFGPSAARERALARLAQFSDQQGPWRLAGLIEVLAELSEAPARRLSISPARPAGRGPDDKLERLIAWLHAHAHEPIRLEAAAAQVPISPGALPRFFRRETGKTLVGYLNDLRIGEACVRLRQSRRPIAEIARDCGFASPAHFERQFQRRVGCTARAYRAGALAYRAQTETRP